MIDILRIKSIGYSREVASLDARDVVYSLIFRGHIAKKVEKRSWVTDCRNLTEPLRDERNSCPQFVKADEMSNKLDRIGSSMKKAPILEGARCSALFAGQRFVYIRYELGSNMPNYSSYPAMWRTDNLLTAASRTIPVIVIVAL
jgi:hypothetical protein